jgi:hypothetical protein
VASRIVERWTALARCIVCRGSGHVHTVFQRSSASMGIWLPCTHCERGAVNHACTHFHRVDCLCRLCDWLELEFPGLGLLCTVVDRYQLAVHCERLEVDADDLTLHRYPLGMHSEPIEDDPELDQ